MDDFADGTYEVLVVDASDEEDDVLRVELVLVSGSRKGQVVTLHARGLGRDAMSLLGLPATLTVRDGSPSLHFD